MTTIVMEKTPTRYGNVNQFDKEKEPNTSPYCWKENDSPLSDGIVPNKNANPVPNKIVHKKFPFTLRTNKINAIINVATVVKTNGLLKSPSAIIDCSPRSTMWPF